MQVLRTVSLVSAILSAGWRVFAAENLTVTITPSFVSHYVFRGVDLGGAAFQPSVELSHGNFTGGIWASTFLSDKVSGGSDPEIDPYASYTIPLNEKLSLIPGFSYYSYPDADGNEGVYRSTFEPFFAASYVLNGVTLTPKIYYDTVLKGPTFEFGAAYSLAPPASKFPLDFSLTIGAYSWKDTAKGSDPKLKNRGEYFQASLSSPIEINDHLTLTLGLMYSRGFNNRYESDGSPDLRNPAAIGRLVASLGCAYSF